MNIPDRVVERVLNKVTIDSNHCFVSWYSVASHGYAQVGWSDGTKMCNTLCHIVAWIATNGPIPDGLTVDHTCHNKKCVNVEHMRLLTNFENARRTNGRDWPLGQCVNGHSNSHLYREPAGRVRCYECKKIWWARSNAKKKATVTRTNPMGDTLNASWLGAVKNPKPSKREDEPASTYSEQDMHYYYLLDLYGPQDTSTPSRRGRHNASQKLG